MHPKNFDPKFDLKIERVVDVPHELVWKAWTQPQHLMPWFCPKPWLTVQCEIDLQPGGKFSTVMQSPEGKQFPNEGCYLEVVPHQKLIWTSALRGGYRPQVRGLPTDDGSFHFTAMLVLESVGNQTRYTAYALHSDEADQKKHADMGFVIGWGLALDQLVAYCQAGIA